MKIIEITPDIFPACENDYIANVRIACPEGTAKAERDIFVKALAHIWREFDVENDGWKDYANDGYIEQDATGVYLTGMETWKRPNESEADLARRIIEMVLDDCEYVQVTVRLHKIQPIVPAKVAYASEPGDCPPED